MSDLILPGDSLSKVIGSETSITIGPGVYKNPKDQSIIPSQAGILKEVNHTGKGKGKLIYIDSNSRRYIPQVNDLVLGTIVNVYSDFYKVSLQEFSPQVQLSTLAFPNASKKNKPNLKVGQAVYARVSEAVPEVVTSIECIDPDTGKEGGFGPLDEQGYIFEVNMNFARELLFNKSCVCLEKLAAKVPFEIAIGINGKVWLKCVKHQSEPNKDEEDVEMEDANEANQLSLKDLKITLAASKFIVACQHVSADDVDTELKKAFKSIL